MGAKGTGDISVHGIHHTDCLSVGDLQTNEVRADETSRHGQRPRDIFHKRGKRAGEI